MKFVVLAAGIILGSVALAQTAQASFPSDGKFKMQPIKDDLWYYYDEFHWYIKAPDKWQHMMGSYASTKVFNSVIDDKLLSNISIEEEMKKGNIAVAIFASTILLFVAMIVTFGFRG